MKKIILVTCITIAMQITMATSITHATECDGPVFIGDTNLDGQLDLADSIYLLNFLFQSGPQPCTTTGDVNENGVMDIADAVFLNSFLYSGGDAPSSYPLQTLMTCDGFDNDGDGEIDEGCPEVWQKNYNIGKPGSNDGVHGLFVDQEFVYVTGSRENVGAYILKLDHQGHHLAEISLPQYGENAGIWRTPSDGGYVVEISTFADDEPAVIIKTDPYGNSIWTYTTPSDDNLDYIIAMRPTFDAGIILLGTTHDGSIYTRKLDASGNSLWQHTYDIPNAHARNIETTHDDGFIIVGRKNVAAPGETENENLLVRLNPEGTLLWNQTVGPDSGMFSYYPYAVRETSDNGFIVTGFKWDTGSIGYTFKTDALGNLEYDHTFAPGDYSNGGRDVIELAMGGYIVAGSAHDSIDGSYIYLQKLNSSLDIEWTTHHVQSDGYHSSRRILQMPTGYLLFAGEVQNPEVSEFERDALVGHVPSDGSEEIILFP